MSNRSSAEPWEFQARLSLRKVAFSENRLRARRLSTFSFQNIFAATSLLLFALGPNCPGQTPQQPIKPPAEDDVIRVYSELVQTDVMVFDKQGKFVNGLKREDFELRIDGKPRAVEFFESVAAGSRDEDAQLSAARGSAQTKRETTAAATVPLDRGRTIFFYIDDFHLSAANTLLIRKLLLSFIDQSLGQNDMAAITSASGSIGFLQQLTDNKAVLRAAVERLSARPAAMKDLQRPTMTEYQALLIDREDRDVMDYFIDALIAENPLLSRESAEQQTRSRSRQILQLTENDTRNTLAGFESLVRSCSKLTGRKLVFFISDGFFLDNRNSDSSYRLRTITSAAARSGVVIYSVDARGLVASLDDPSVSAAFDPTGRLSRGSAGELVASQDAMNALARDTGGRPIFNTNALDVGLGNAVKETSVYYLLAWRPDPESGADKFRKISVTLKGRPELVVRVRQGFFDREAPSLARKQKIHDASPTATEPVASDNLLRDSLRDPFPSSEIGIATNLGYVEVPNKGIALTVSAQIDAAAIQFVKDGTGLKGQIDIRGTVYNDQGKAGANFNDRLTITATSAEQLARTSKELIYNYQVFLTPGIYQVRVGARDPASGMTGTAFEWILVPNLANHQLALSSIVTGERLPGQTVPVAGAIDGTAEATLRVDRRFHRNSSLRFLFYVYNAQKSSADSKPDVALQVLVLRDQEPVITTPAKKISTEGLEDLDRIPYGGDLSLEGLIPGRYILQISVVDRIAKTSTTQRVKFEVR